MSLVSYNELCAFAAEGLIIGVKPEHINGTSIDVTLGPIILAEAYRDGNQTVSLRDKQNICTRRVDITDSWYDLKPNEFVLGGTEQVFNLPSHISAEFKLNSSGARIGLENALATWCDPFWYGSVLTLELKNFTQWHTIRLHHGVRIGQIIFHKSEPVPRDKGYAVRGRYNNDATAQGVKE
jgi:deoxycytidine triphosphate deaminase